MDEKTLILECREEIISASVELNESGEQIIIEWFGHRSGKIRREAAVAFAKQHHSSMDNFIQRLLESKNDNVRWSTAVALGRIGTKMPSVFQALHLLGTDLNWSVRESVAMALIDIQTKTKSLPKEVLVWQKDSDENVRRALAESLGRGLGQKKPEECFAILRNMAGDNSVYVRKAVANSYRNISRKFPELVISELLSWQEAATDCEMATLADGLRTIAKNNPELALSVLKKCQDRGERTRRMTDSVMKEMAKQHGILAGKTQTST